MVSRLSPRERHNSKALLQCYYSAVLKFMWGILSLLEELRNFRCGNVLSRPEQCFAYCTKSQETAVSGSSYQAFLVQGNHVLPSRLSTAKAVNRPQSSGTLNRDCSCASFLSLLIGGRAIHPRKGRVSITAASMVGKKPVKTS